MPSAFCTSGVWRIQSGQHSDSALSDSQLHEQLKSHLRWMGFVFVTQAVSSQPSAAGPAGCWGCASSARPWSCFAIVLLPQAPRRAAQPGHTARHWAAAGICACCPPAVPPKAPRALQTHSCQQQLPHLEQLNRGITTHNLFPAF